MLQSRNTKPKTLGNLLACSGDLGIIKHGRPCPTIVTASPNTFSTTMEVNVVSNSYSYHTIIKPHDEGFPLRKYSCIRYMGPATHAHMIRRSCNQPTGTTAGSSPSLLASIYTPSQAIEDSQQRVAWRSHQAAPFTRTDAHQTSTALISSGVSCERAQISPSSQHNTSLGADQKFSTSSVEH